MGARGRARWAGVRVRVGVSVPVRACPRGCTCWYSCGCVGVRACGRMGVLVSVFLLLTRCIYVCFYFTCSYLFAFHCINNTRHNTIHNDHCTPLSDPFAAVWLFFLICLEFFSPCRDPDPAWTPTSTWRCSRGRHQLRANAPEYGAPWLSNAGAGSEASRPRAR